MIFCENSNCESPEEPVERTSDYRFLENMVVCTHCYEMEMDAQEEINANQPDYDYELR